MPDSYFTLITDDPADDPADDTAGVTERHWRFATGPDTVGPWSPHHQHGGPPNALAVACAESVVSTATGRADLVPVRLASDFLGPVPVADLAVRARMIRAGRSAALVETTLSAAGRDCLQARVWFVRAADTSALPGPGTAPPPLPDVETGFGLDMSYGASIEWRFVRGGLTEPGPGAVWARPRVALMDGYDYSGLARTVLVADSASGVSSELDWAQWSFANVDLDVHLLRPPQGDWVFLDAVTRLGPSGSALAASTLSDTSGIVGAGMQTLVVAPLRR